MIERRLEMFCKQNAYCTVTVWGGPNWGWAYEYLCQVQKSEDEPNFPRWNGEVGKTQCSWLGNDVYDEAETGMNSLKHCKNVSGSDM